MLFCKRNFIEGNGSQLCSHRYGDHSGNGDVIEDAHQPAAQEPEEAEGTLEDAVSGGPIGFGHHGGDSGFENGFLGAHSHAPQSDAQQQCRD